MKLTVPGPWSLVLGPLTAMMIVAVPCVAQDAVPADPWFSAFSIVASPAEVVKRITDEDPGRAPRQVAVIDTKGRSAVYTGKRVIDRNHDSKDLVHLGGYAGHCDGPQLFGSGQHFGQ